MALIKKHLNIEPITRPGTKGQFEVIADGKTIVKRGGNWITQKFGAGYPDLNTLINQLQQLSNIAEK